VVSEDKKARRKKSIENILFIADNYFNERQPGKEIKEEYRQYWTNDFERIFSH